MTTETKWETVEKFEHIRKGDFIRMTTTTTHARKGLTELKVMEGTAKYLNTGDEGLGEWVLDTFYSVVNADHEEDNKSTLVERKVAPFVYPTEFGAIIEGEWNRNNKDTTVQLVYIGGGEWVSKASRAHYDVWDLNANLINKRIIREGL